MKSIEIIPFEGVGKIKLGMTKEQVRAAIDSPASNIPAHNNSGIEFPESDYFLDSSIQVTYSPITGTVDWIGINDIAPFDVFYKDLNLFKSEVSEVVSFTEQFGALDNNAPELGYSYSFPELGLCYWRESITENLINELEEAEDDEEREWMLEDIEKSKHFQQVSIFVRDY